MAATRPLLEVRDLHVIFSTLAGPVRAVDGIDFSIGPGEVLAVVGESGSGKSATAMALLGLLPGSATVTGSVMFEGTDLLCASRRHLRGVRGNAIGMVFQDPMTALNPLFTVGHQIGEALRVHRGAGRRQARAATIEALGSVGIPSPDLRVDDYPHQLSGGMRQRAVIAMATICQPRLLIADEPTTALDVTIQAQILELLLTYREQHATSILLITHDLGVVAGQSDRVLVMYGGQAHEQADVETLFYEPRGPYTWGLLDSIPRVDDASRKRLATIPGVPAGGAALPPGCRFQPRCALAQERCQAEMPALRPVGADHWARCHFADQPDWSRAREQVSRLVEP